MIISQSCRPFHGPFQSCIYALLATLALCFAMASPALSQEFLSEGELLEVFPGNMVQSKSDDGTPWAQAYSEPRGRKKGIISGNFGGEKYSSKWSVKKGMWCEDWGSGNACWQVERASPGHYRMYKDGTPRPNLWKLQ